MSNLFNCCLQGKSKAALIAESLKTKNQNEKNVPPLILTPFLKHGSAAEALEAARVYLRPLLEKEPKGGKIQVKWTEVESYSGFFTVNPTYNSNLFFWFFPAREDPLSAPVVLFLSGGPGTPSTSVAFNNGAIQLDEDLETLRIRQEFSWAEKQSMLYIDSPVGTGFSFTDDMNGYSQNDGQIADNLYEALIQFFQLFSTYKTAPFFIAGNSYSGKITPKLACKIHERNQGLGLGAPVRLNLKGVLLMSPLLDPMSMVNIAEVHYAYGLYDEKTRDELLALETVASEKAKSGEIMEALNLLDSIHGVAFNTSSTFTQKTGYDSIFEGLLFTKVPSRRKAPYRLLATPEFRAALHVGEGIPMAWNNPQVMYSLLTGLFEGAIPHVEQLLSAKENYRVMILSGMVDIGTPAATVARVIQRFNWPHLAEFSKTERQIIRIRKMEETREGGTDYRRNSDYNLLIAGYWKQFRNLNHAIVRLAGHHVWFDQLQFSTEFLTLFTHGG